MSKPTAPALLLEPKIPTGNRSVFPKGKPPTPIIFGMSLLPAMGFGIALSDDRVGFKLFMAGLAIMLLIFVIALYLWAQALSAGTIRIEAGGMLRFVPPTYLRTTFYVVAIGFLVPAAIKIAVTVFDLPTMRAGTWIVGMGPCVIAIITIVLLVMLVMSARVPNGLTVGPEGLRGVRGGSRVNIAWDDLVSASAPGEHGPKLTLVTRSNGPVTVDAHYLGSDPAIVANVIEYFRQNPGQRHLLSVGAEAVGAVENAAR